MIKAVLLAIVIGIVFLLLATEIIDLSPTQSKPQIEGLTEFQVGMIEKYCSSGTCSDNEMTREEKIEFYRQANYDTAYDRGLIFDEDGYNKQGFDKDGFDRIGLNERGITAEQQDEAQSAYAGCLERRDNTPDRCLSYSGGSCLASLKSDLWNHCSQQLQSTIERLAKENNP